MGCIRCAGAPPGIAAHVATDRRERHSGGEQVTCHVHVVEHQEINSSRPRWDARAETGSFRARGSWSPRPTTTISSTSRRFEIQMGARSHDGWPERLGRLRTTAPDESYYLQRPELAAPCRGGGGLLAGSTTTCPPDVSSLSIRRLEPSNHLTTNWTRPLGAVPLTAPTGAAIVLAGTGSVAFEAGLTAGADPTTAPEKAAVPRHR